MDRQMELKVIPTKVYSTITSNLLVELLMQRDKKLCKYSNMDTWMIGGSVHISVGNLGLVPHWRMWECY